MRFFVVCTSSVDGAMYVLSEVSEIAGASGDARISGGIAGDDSVVMTRSEMDGDDAAKVALHAWDLGDESAFDRETFTRGTRRVRRLHSVRVAPENDDTRLLARAAERRRDIDDRVTHARAARLRALETRARCEEMREAMLRQRRQSIALREVWMSRGAGRHPSQPAEIELT
jgi:hypothetical protein